MEPSTPVKGGYTPLIYAVVFFVYVVQDVLCVMSHLTGVVLR